MFVKSGFLRLGLCALGLVVLCGATPAFEPVSLTSQQKDGVEELQGQFYSPVDRTVAWNVLTDYGHIPEFVPNMKVSRIERQNGNDVLLAQEMEGGFLFITKRVHLLLKIHETPMKTIAFIDEDHRDFSVYQGYWNIETCAGGVSVLYQLTACKKFDVPLAGDALNGGVKDLLADVQKEIFFRQGLTGRESGWGTAVIGAPVAQTASK
jgi:hypothetical protein